MRGAGRGDSNLKLFFGAIRGLKAGEQAHITQKEALEDKKFNDLENIKEVSGLLTKIEFKEREWQGDTIKELKLWLRDDESQELFILSVGFNSIGRSIMNTLCNLTAPIGELYVGVYNKKGSDYASVMVKHNGEKAGWKYSIEEQSKHVVSNEITRKGKLVIEKDYYKLDELLVTEIKANIIPSLDKTPAKFAEAGAGAKSGGNKLNAEDVLKPEITSDDLPF